MVFFTRPKDSTENLVTNFQLKSTKSSEILPKNLLFGGD